jgi:hypothetical protein
MTRILSTNAWRTAVGALVAFSAATVGSPIHAQGAAAAAGEAKAVVAVLEFDNAAMVKRDEFAAMTVGVQVMLANALATNGRCRSSSVRRSRRSRRAELGTAGRLTGDGEVGNPRRAVCALGAIVVTRDGDAPCRARRHRDVGAGVHGGVAGKATRFSLVDQLAGKINTD